MNNREDVEKRMVLMADAVAEQVNADNMDLAGLTIEVGVASMLAEIAMELSAIREMMAATHSKKENKWTSIE